MKNLLKPFLFIVFAFCAMAVHAQTEPVQSILSQEDIDKLIKTMKPIQKDIEALGVKYEDLQDPTAADAIKANEDVKAVLKKHGWEENYFVKIQTIASGFAFIAIQSEFTKLPTEQQEQMKQVIEAQKAQFLQAISEEDLALVQKNFDALAVAFGAQ